ncbi:hypothetical protein AWM75_07810 [Aerococcus urinaehominis]|uniref:UDP-N-acetylglucosamine 2-epimerase domain-containing protein n=1 Tax=Aerococcus urinaehominis TaxID=128944 RepID=A0A0X8FNF7_9LACT|nr:UDP-N-acetylglucosamine 2-epimerase [Aerococcus urinaehominis]AMB99877.1 hypothetical protein AWM75_07810 [Aerococcus urinaehominis]SDM54660.1 UDP-N-acetylglucosamine 2-epimerase (non-hydrolysing) [Aerococcus urinaehominis]
MYRVAYVTGSRAEYGIVKRYLKELSLIPDIDLEILVTGTHLEKNFSHTIDEIIQDGFDISYRVPIQIDTIDNKAITNSMGIALKEFGRIFYQENYDLVIILGDRYEMLAVATAAAMNSQKILHLHGGEKTLGNYDEFIRHAITKMSLYHFTSTEEYRNRVIQLGEAPDRVFNLGALGADNAIANIDKSYEPPVKMPYFVILFHPETSTGRSTTNQINQLLSALDNFKNHYQMVFIGGNADTSSDQIASKVYEYTKKNGMTYIKNLENKDFQNLVHNSQVYIGNSSSGLLEAPSLGTFSVNIGRRQEGRIRGNSVIDCDATQTEIIEAIEKAISLSADNIVIENPYYQVNCLKNYVFKTVELLKRDDNFIKDFYDIDLRGDLYD